MSQAASHVVQDASERDRLRREMRARRRALSIGEREDASKRIASIARRCTMLRSGTRIAAYLAHGAEADLHRLITLAHAGGCEVYLPAISDYRRFRMDFLRLEPDTTLHVNRYGIPEPQRRGAISVPVRHLDLIFVPLVAVDHAGCRLGSGAGFYDRALHHLRAGRLWRRPKLIGVGYDFQRVARLEPARWDVPLDAVITERALYPTHLFAPR